MTKLKCWKPKKDLYRVRRFENRGSKDVVTITKDRIGYNVNLMPKNKRMHKENFLFKRDALKFINSYMKKYDKC